MYFYGTLREKKNILENNAMGGKYIHVSLLYICLCILVSRGCRLELEASYRHTLRTNETVKIIPMDIGQRPLRTQLGANVFEQMIFFANLSKLLQHFPTLLRLGGR